MLVCDGFCVTRDICWQVFSGQSLELWSSDTISDRGSVNCLNLVV